MGAVPRASRPVVAGNPLFCTRCVVLDRGVIIASGGAKAVSRHIDIAGNVNVDSKGLVIAIRQPIVTSKPLLLPG